MFLRTKFTLTTCLAVFFMSFAALLFVTGCPTDANANNGDPVDNPDDPDDPDDPGVPSGKTYTEAEGDGTLVSLGKATGTGTTYYIDAANGNDSWDGLTPVSPWKSFKNPNAKTFKPGDHILLEANSIWNGVSVNQSNLATLLTTNANRVGMLYPKGSGSDRNHIVIDLYRIEDWSADEIKVFYSANKRPIINGNGTPAPGSNRWFHSGAITLLNQHHWRIRNIECTNTFKDFLTVADHWKEDMVPKHLEGIMVMGYGDTRNNPDYRGVVDPNVKETYNIIIEQCYVHDVQSMHQNNSGGGDFAASTALGGGAPSPIFKITGGIIVYGMHYTEAGTAVPPSNQFNGYNGLLFEGNIVKRVGMEGLRNKHVPDGTGYSSSNVVFRGNYLEEIFGDAIVIDGIQRNTALNARGGYLNGLVENNVIKDACATPYSSGTGGNYASVWAMTAYDTTFRYNEAYGNVYGYNDGEAWDIDIGSDKVIYEYNYSHHNSGGTILFMNEITNGIFRYNIAANDGGGTKYMATITNGVNQDTTSYKNWNNGQSYFHYTNTGTIANNQKPLIYNNTFYTGDGITTGVYGHMATTPLNKYVRFYNNVIVKEGTGTVFMSYGHQGNGQAGYIYNPTGFKNNMLWAYETADPNTGVEAKFNNGSQGMGTLIGQNGNTFQNPKLQIQGVASKVAELREQRDTKFPESDYVKPAELAKFTSTARMRARASMFSPVDNSSPVIGAGMTIPKSPNSPDLDGAWNDLDAATEDIFGTAISGNTPIGAAVGPYTAQ